MNEAYSPDLPCTLCGTIFNDHGGRQHPFVGPNEDPGAALKKPEKKKPETPRLIITPAPDLVLRQLLLRKGIITTEELEVVERELTVGVLGIQTSGQTSDVRTQSPPD